MLARARTFWSCLGPGVLLAATSVGAIHLVLAPWAVMLPPDRRLDRRRAHGGRVRGVPLVDAVVALPVIASG